MCDRSARGKVEELALDNVVMESQVFRKLHLELGHGKQGFQVIHCVMFPRTSYKIPLCCFDAVAFEVKAWLPAHGGFFTFLESNGTELSFAFIITIVSGASVIGCG